MAGVGTAFIHEALLQYSSSVNFDRANQRQKNPHFWAISSELSAAASAEKTQWQKRLAMSTVHITVFCGP